jgi:hypothetical protein
VQVAGPAGGLDDLGDVGKAEVAHGDGLEGADFQAAVAAVAGTAAHEHTVPRQAGAARQQDGLVGLDHNR